MCWGIAGRRAAPCRRTPRPCVPARRDRADPGGGRTHSIDRAPVITAAADCARLLLALMLSSTSSRSRPNVFFDYSSTMARPTHCPIRGSVPSRIIGFLNQGQSRHCTGSSEAGTNDFGSGATNDWWPGDGGRMTWHSLISEPYYSGLAVCLHARYRVQPPGVGSSRRAGARAGHVVASPSLVAAAGAPAGPGVRRERRTEQLMRLGQPSA
jgi:hypothetical protein